jgi:RimJ/RimL family protein N-acetyltransferase
MLTVCTSTDPEPVLEGADSALRTVLLGEADRDRLRTHLLRLDPDDRRMRFMRAMSDVDIATFATDADFGPATRLGFVDLDGHLVALAEGFSYAVGSQARMEVAFSTDAGWRRRGLATRLFHAMGRIAQERGIERLVLQCDRRNTGMRRLLRNVGAQTCDESGEIEAVWNCTGPHA